MKEKIASEVLIVGAGPTGLTLACALAQRGGQVRIVDAASSPPTGRCVPRGMVYAPAIERPMRRAWWGTMVPAE